jgi:ribosomal protein S12
MTSYVNEGNTIYWIEIDDVFYVLDVSNFDIPDMQYFIVKQEGDTISFLAQNTIIVDLLP